MTNLPGPVTSTEMYLAALLAELKALRADLLPDSVGDDGKIDLREPAATPKPSGRSRKKASTK